MLGLEVIAHFTHVLENLLARLRGGEIRATRPVVDALLASADVLRRLLRSARANDDAEVPEFDETLHALEALAGGGGAVLPAARLAPPREAPLAPTLYEIRFTPPSDLLRRGLDPIRILDTLEQLGVPARVEVNLSGLPSLEEMDPEGSYLGFTCWLSSRAPTGRIRECFEFVADEAAVTIEAHVASEPDAGEPTAAPAAGRAERGSGDRRADAEVATEASTIRVPTEKVDRLIDLVGELVITQSMVAQLVTHFSPERLGQLADAVAQMDRHARDLQERVMAVRMLPIRKLFSRFPRLVRDLCRLRGKQVALEAAGEDTELDKGVIEQITDPLIHLIRNAVDHGIEAPAVRLQAGKPEIGRLTLSAFQQGGNIHIEVADDGRGLDRERILAKARELGLVSADEALADAEVFALIFQPGFSTADEVSEISGRGVGMDVVKRNLEALGGSITVQTEPGRGTTFRAKLPLTLAIVDGQAMQVGDETYIIPLASIVESVQPRRESLHQVFGVGDAIAVRGRVLPMLRLHRLFGLTPRSEDPTDGLVVIAEHEGRQAALLVDELLGQQQVVIKSLEANFQKLQGVAGATILGDGRVALILDVPGLVAMSRSASRVRERVTGGPTAHADALVEAGR
jgi:two-component system chemotaxis sensor kinase CheA